MVARQSTSKSPARILLLALSAALILLLHFFQPTLEGLWWRTFYESLHAVVFSIVAVAIYAVFRLSCDWSVYRCALTAGVLAIAASVLSEAAQIPGPRDASLEDLMTDILGALGALLVAVAVDRPGLARWQSKLCVFSAGAAILIMTLLPLLSVSAAYIDRYFRFPTLISFDSDSSVRFLRTQNATLQVYTPTDGSRRRGRVTLNSGHWPGLHFHDVWADWREYSVLALELELPGDRPLDINIRVHDRPHGVSNQPYSDRFNMGLVLQPGRHTLQIPLDRVRTAPKTRDMDMAQIDGIVIFCSADQSGRSFELIEVRLE